MPTSPVLGDPKMTMAARKIRKGKRRWYPLKAPKIFNEQSLGETFVYETEQIQGKHLAVNLMALTGNPKKQNMRVFFEVSDIKEGVAHTRLRGIEMQHSAVRRLVRRGRSKVTDSFITKTKKGQGVRVKVIVMTRSRTDAATQSALRKRSRELLQETLAKHSFSTVVNDVVNMRLQRYLKDQLGAIFPVRSVDVRHLGYTDAKSEDESDVEESSYAERPKRERPVEEEDAGSLASLKEELDEALAAEKEVVDHDAKPAKRQAKKVAKKTAKKSSTDDEDDDEE
jgi:ribosomal protein S3AE